MAQSIAAALTRWREAPDISARSVLVTVFGDSILPVTTEFWLAQLFDLTEALGFNDRLIRTSMFRLAAEDWLTNQRIGRQSRYTLTPLAIRESEQASQRIYHQNSPDWTGAWTLVMLSAPMLAAHDREALSKHLVWNGFFPLGTDVLASPAATPDSVAELLDLMDGKPAAAVATAEFVDLERLVGDGFFAGALNTPAIEADYEAFVDRYRLLSPSVDGCTPLEAFPARTMLVHDLRRIRLRSPDMPTDLLPAGWAGDDAQAVAADLYRRLSERAAEALSSILELDYPTGFPDRF